MDEILRKPQKAKYISTIKLNRAFHQISLKITSKPIAILIASGKELFQFQTIMIILGCGHKIGLTRLK